MQSYEVRSQLIKQLSNQAYFDALKRLDAQKKDVRVGAYDGRTGRYQILHADGGITSNGISLSNAAPPADGFVRGQQNPNNNAIAIGYRRYQEEDFIRVLEEEVVNEPPLPFVESFGVLSIFLSTFQISEVVSQEQFLSTENEENVSGNFVFAPPFEGYVATGSVTISGSRIDTQFIQIATIPCDEIRIRQTITLVVNVEPDEAVSYEIYQSNDFGVTYNLVDFGTAVARSDGKAVLTFGQDEIFATGWLATYLTVV